MHSSTFSYSITRPYPFKWFTPLVFVGGALALVIFSFISFVTTGYSLTVEFTPDPNTTESQGIWFRNWPSILTAKVQPNCQSIDIPVNTKFFTNQTGLTYTLLNVSQPQSNASSSVSSSLTYHNNNFHDCALDSIEINLEQFSRAAAQISRVYWGAILRGYITCNIIGAGSAGNTSIDLVVEYDQVPDQSVVASPSSVLISLDKNKRASLWWGQSLLAMYWAQMVFEMYDANLNFGWIKGSVFFTTNHSHSGDIISLDYFHVEPRFIQDPGDGSVLVWSNSTTIGDLVHRNWPPNIWLPADNLIKSFCSTILTDLGQNTSRYPNILTNETLLQYFTSNFSQMYHNFTTTYASQTASLGPATDDYNSRKTVTGPLGVGNSVISTKYLCQVPKRKSAGSAFVAILVQDLVFLQASWQLLKFLTGTFWLTKKKAGPKFNYCAGCLERETSSNVALQSLTPVKEREDPSGTTGGRPESQQRLLSP